MSGRGDPTITLVGIGAEGWSGLSGTSQAALCQAGVVLGSPRQLDLLPPQVSARRVCWGSPLLPSLGPLVEQHRGDGLVVLASGDPMHFGVGRALIAQVGPDAVHVLPHPSSITLACARLGWPVEDVTVVSGVGRPLESVRAALHEGARVLLLSAGAQTPGELAELLTASGYGDSTMNVLAELGADTETLVSSPARDWPGDQVSALNIVGVECRRDPAALRLGLTPGLPDEAYLSDGQLTKRDVRAITLATLAPAPGELLWDVGAGSGSISIEWMRAHPSARAIAIESHPNRAARIEANARALGVPALRLVQGRAPQALQGLPSPDAIFVGGGLTSAGLLDQCWAALRPGGRLVANTVTLDSEALLFQAYQRLGGQLTRIAIEKASAVGSFTSWTPARPVTQWSVVKG
ncbi:precorrin-6y C5,15-methyltransferase (decarboxylating) subunit CbiE [Gephyromycinifex aptenodytis]|uniref:precorrin-6y C5,15-methyltransferase (decarboxylating) subunit CbiE n=1 Tax=Gephyromycinifex aptenodytis TaxID=2716227 RepID=UPI0014471D22|nr:precorrin-6y C5,15-methyltransferase (decarboxylating) subunit CbiE [Gephyromycinifex aptenodytis]